MIIYYDLFQRSFIGPVLFAATLKGLSAVTIGRATESRRMKYLGRLFPGWEIKSDPSRLSRYRKELEAYFSGSGEHFSLPLDYAAVRGSFYKKVLEECRKIPYGKVAGYGHLAERAGSPKAARAVGNALGANPLPIVIPCHRVIASSGTLGGFTGGLHLKKKLLMHEGISLDRSQLKLLLKDSIRRNQPCRSGLAVR